jgi:hypothetical protein
MCYHRITLMVGVCSTLLEKQQYAIHLGASTNNEHMIESVQIGVIEAIIYLFQITQLKVDALKFYFPLNCLDGEIIQIASVRCCCFVFTKLPKFAYKHSATR